MTTLEFLDVFREFLGELIDKKVTDENREKIKGQLVTSLQEILNSFETGEPVKPEGETETVQEKTETVIEEEKPVEKKSEEIKPDEEKKSIKVLQHTGGNSNINLGDDYSSMQESSNLGSWKKQITVLIQSGGNLPRVWKTRFEGSLDGPINVSQLTRSLVQFGCKKLDESTVQQLFEPFLKDGKLNMNSLARFLSS